MTRLEGSQVPRGVLPSESETLKRARGDEPGGKGLGSGSAEGAAEKQRGAEGARGARRAGGATWALASASQTQGGRVLFGFQSEIRDAGVLAGGLGGGGGGHDGGGGGRVRGQRGQRQSEGRRREHHVGRVRSQVRVQVVVRVRHGAVQLQLRLNLKGQGRHVAMTILG